MQTKSPRISEMNTFIQFIYITFFSEQETIAFFRWKKRIAKSVYVRMKKN